MGDDKLELEGCGLDLALMQPYPHTLPGLLDPCAQPLPTLEVVNPTSLVQRIQFQCDDHKAYCHDLSPKIYNNSYDQSTRPAGGKLQ